MKPHTLPVKRRPVPKGVLKRLSAVTGNRHQRAATAAAAESDLDDGSSRISRALTIIFLIHIVAIGLIFVHQKFLDGRAPAGAEEDATVPVAAAPVRSDVRKLSNGARPYIPRQGDNYARIAKAQGVDEAELRKLNENIDIQSGKLIELPPPRPVVVTPARRPDSAPAAEASDGLVDAIPVDVRGAPRAKVVSVDTEATPSASSYTVQSGDSIWRIANRFKVDQNALMKLNGISDARKMKIGMELKIPN